MDKTTERANEDSTPSVDIEFNCHLEDTLLFRRDNNSVLSDILPVQWQW